MIACSLSKHAQTAQDEIEDMVQDVFVELMDALKSYDSSRPIEAYIFEIARRVRISRYRKVSALKRGGPQVQHVNINPHDAHDMDGAITIPNPQDNQETSLSKAQESWMLRHALRSISSKCQQVLGMRYDQSLSYKEIAAHIDVNEGTLRVIVQRCLAKLSEAYSLLELKEVG
jgi:RNA polymerase sigma factor (sigma-70 family)